jgi:hypothetical protein
MNDVIHNALVNLFSLIGFSFSEINDEVAHSWSYSQIELTEKMNYSGFDIVLTGYYTDVIDFMIHTNPAFRQDLQKGGFAINSIIYREGSRSADIRVYIEIDSNIN